MWFATDLCAGSQGKATNAQPEAAGTFRGQPTLPYYYKRAGMRMLTRLTVLCAGESGTFGRAGAGKLRVRVTS